MHASFVALCVRRGIHDLSSLGHLGNALAQHGIQVQTDECDCCARQNEHMKREETRERRTGNLRAAKHDRAHLIADHRHAINNRGADAEPPVRIRIPTHDLPCEREAEREDAKAYAEEPRQFTRILIGSVEEHL